MPKPFPSAAAAALVLSACAGPITARGNVVTCADQKPVEGAKITVRNHDQVKVHEALGTDLPPAKDSTTTDASGHFGPAMFRDAKENGYATVIVEKPGYKTTSASYPNGWPRVPPTICVEPGK